MHTNCARHADARLGIREEARFVNSDGESILVITHAPLRRPRGGVLLCGSLFAERLRTYRDEIGLARALAQRGLAVARFDYRGSGHSQGAADKATLGTMVADARLATETLRNALPGDLNASSAQPPLAFVGLRWGALVAAQVAAQPEWRTAPVGLLQPVAGAGELFDDAFRACALQAMASGGRLPVASPGTLRRWMTSDGWVDVLGFPLTRLLYESAPNDTLEEALRCGPREVLLMQYRAAKQRNAEERIVAACNAGGSHVTQRTIDAARESWWFLGGDTMPLPTGLVRTTIDWLDIQLMQAVA